MTLGPADTSGFTLIECLVALTILGVSAAAIVRAVEQHVDRIGALEQRAAGLWVAQNALAELNLGAPSALGTAEMLGKRWAVTIVQAGSDDPDIAEATIQVAPEGSADPLVILRGFVDRKTITR